MKGLSSTTPPARGLQARAAACTPKKGEGTGRTIKRQRCRLKPLRPELRSPVFAGLVADRKSSASKPPAEMRSSVTTAPKLVRRPARARPGQVPAACWRWVAFGQVAYRLPTSDGKEKTPLPY